MSDEVQNQENALQLLFEDNPGDNRNATCLSGLADVMYTYCRSYLYPLIDYEHKFKDDDWEIPYDSLTELEYVGAGAFGKVYSAKLKGELVAVKIPEDKRETDMKYLRELKHENIVRFRGVCTKGPSHCVVMEFCQYGSLYNFLHSGTRIMINRIFKWAKEIALAMAYLHSRNIIHRDLKSPNILIADNLVVKVSDFGTSRKWEKFSFVMTTRGTTYWMAPEMMLGKKCSDRVDVWSYGVVLWELLTQEVPYENLHPCAVTYGVGREKISLPLPSTFPLHLRILLSHCWHREPRSRPSFNRISDVLTLAWEQWSWLGDDLFISMQDAWKQEIDMYKNNGWQSIPPDQTQLIPPQKQNRMLYKKIMREASKMYMDACALYLRLEQREVAIAEREMAYDGMRHPKSLMNYRRRNSTSSSSGNSVGQMTVVKLQHGLSNKARTVTEVVTTGSVTKESVMKGSVTKESVMKGSFAKESVINGSVTKESAMNGSATKESAMNGSVTKESAMNGSVTKESTTKEMVTSATFASRVVKSDVMTASAPELNNDFNGNVNKTDIGCADNKINDNYIEKLVEV